MKSLADIFTKYPGTDKDGAGPESLHSYAPVYEQLFAPYLGKPIQMLEVGVRDGSSLKAWREYFGDVFVVGVDNGSEKGLWVPDDPHIRVEYADSTLPGTVTKAVKTWAPFDVTIDDGCHKPLVQAATFAELWPFVKPGGIYVVEDLETIEGANEFVRHFGGEVIDRRNIKGRHDDILVVLHKGK